MTKALWDLGHPHRWGWACNNVPHLSEYLGTWPTVLRDVKGHLNLACASRQLLRPHDLGLCCLSAFRDGELLTVPGALLSQALFLACSPWCGPHPSDSGPDPSAPQDEPTPSGLTPLGPGGEMTQDTEQEGRHKRGV